MEEKTEIMTIQPYFVLDADAFCQRLLFQNGISHFYSFCNPSDEDISVKLLVDGCSNIIFEYARRADGSFSLRTHWLGSTMVPRTFWVRRNCEYFCVRLQPSAASFIQEFTVKDSVGKTIILDDFPSMKEFCQLMEAQRGFDARMKAFQDFYESLIRSRAEHPKMELVRQIADLIIQRRGMVKVSELERLSGYSARYINQIFEKELGFSAKQLCNSVKFQFLLNDMNCGLSASLTALSSEYDFYDQSHFIREFRNWTGTTPSEYASDVSRRSYRQNVMTL